MGEGGGSSNTPQHHQKNAFFLNDKNRIFLQSSLDPVLSRAGIAVPPTRTMTSTTAATSQGCDATLASSSSAGLTMEKGMDLKPPSAFSRGRGGVGGEEGGLSPPYQNDTQPGEADGLVVSSGYAPAASASFKALNAMEEREQKNTIATGVPAGVSESPWGFHWRGTRGEGDVGRVEEEDDHGGDVVVVDRMHSDNTSETGVVMMPTEKVLLNEQVHAASATRLMGRQHRSRHHQRHNPPRATAKSREDRKTQPPSAARTEEISNGCSHMGAAAPPPPTTPSSSSSYDVSSSSSESVLSDLSYDDDDDRDGDSDEFFYGKEKEAKQDGHRPSLQHASTRASSSLFQWRG